MAMTNNSSDKPRIRSRQPSVSRKPGRPVRQSGQVADARSQLLDAAIACFVRNGIAATSLREIAREAHVSPALLNYYFGDKHQLQLALVQERLLPALAPLQMLLQEAGDDVEDLVAGFVIAVEGIAIANPWLPALWVREVVCEGGALRDLLLQRIGPQIPQVMVQRFAAAQARGELNAALDPRLLMVSLVGLTLFPIAGAPIWRRLFAADDLGFPTLRRHTQALLEGGIGARQGDAT